MIHSIDFAILDWISRHFTGNFWNSFMVFVTKLGDHGLFWIVLTLVLFIPKKTRNASIAMGIALFFGTLVGNVVLKNLLARPRPFQVREIFLLIPPPSGYSFPSGHTLSSFAAATALFLYHKKWGIPALVLAGFIGFSRLYLQVHFPTDVVVGMLLGILSGVLGYQLSKPVSEIVDKILPSRKINK